jgi:cytochrome P450
MTVTRITTPGVSDPVPVLPVGRPHCLPESGWTVTRASDVRAVLADPSYAVPTAPPGGPAGSISWLRGSVSRFANGAEHARRRARVLAELAELPPALLRAEASRRAHAVIDGAAGAGRIEVMTRLARPVPTAVLAACLGIGDAGRAAEAVAVTAAAYFPGAPAERDRAADASTAELVELLGPADEDVIVAKIAVLIQSCDATASLIGRAVCQALPPAAGREPAGWRTEAILAEVARYDPPLRVSYRISARDTELGGQPVPAGSAMHLHVDSANRDPEVCRDPEEFDPGRGDGADLTFGSGLRPCPGREHALALAAGVVQAVRDRGLSVTGPVEYEPAGAVRIPVRVEVSLRPESWSG